MKEKIIKNFIKLIIGDLDEKREYKQMMKRVNALPKDYKLAFKKIQKYIYSGGQPGCGVNIFINMTIFTDLIDFFEISAKDGKHVLEVTGEDVAGFCDEFIRDIKN